MPGPFYVEQGCCLSGGIWELDAAAHFSWDEDPYPSCFVSRQPTTEAEAHRVAAAMASREVDCIRFRGPNAAWRQMLKDEGLEEYIDRER